MAYDDYMADRVRQVFADKHVSFVEKRMMGGLCFMVDDKMCVGVGQDKEFNDRLMVRLDPEIYADALTRSGAQAMDFTGRPMKGFVFVYAEGFDDDEDLERWIQLALDFNPKAKSSKKTRKK
ncbi:MAG: TfoX/Sxy family protein [Arenicella sp.]